MEFWELFFCGKQGQDSLVIGGGFWRLLWEGGGIGEERGDYGVILWAYYLIKYISTIETCSYIITISTER